MISIIVPIYKVEQYLKECVESILMQSYTDFELILVDDGSPDNCGSICDDYAKVDDRIRVIHKVNGGLSDARNAGLKVARGDHIGFVDSDDWIEPDMYECLYNACIENGADITICGFYRDFKDKSITNVKFKKEVFSGDTAVRKLIDGSQIQDHAWTKLYKADLWRGIEYPFGKSYEDIRTTYKTFLKAGRVCTVPKALYHYRQRSGSISKSGLDAKKLEWLDAVIQQKKYFSKEISLDRELEKHFSKKILYTKGCLLREWLLTNNMDASKDNTDSAKRLYLDIRDGKKTIIESDYFTKSIKTIAFLSFLPLPWIRSIFHSIIMKKYISDTYSPYE